MNKEKILLWTNRLVAFLAIGFWISVIYAISQMSTPFMEQAPYCIGSTILIFGLLRAVHKGLDYFFNERKG